MAPSHARDLLCFSKQRWTSPPQCSHPLLGRAAADHRVYLLEAPVLDGDLPCIQLRATSEGVVVAVPHLPALAPNDLADAWQRSLLERMIVGEHLDGAVHWYDSVDALRFAGHLPAAAVVYDCTAEVTPSAALVRRADVVVRARTQTWSETWAMVEAACNLHAPAAWRP